MSAPARPPEGCALPPPGRWSRSDRRAVQTTLEARNRRTALKLAAVALALFLFTFLGYLA